MRINTDNEFRERVLSVRKRLPARFFAILEYEYPGRFSKTHIYSVLSRNVEDIEALEAMEFIANKLEFNRNNFKK